MACRSVLVGVRGANRYIETQLEAVWEAQLSRLGYPPQVGDGDVDEMSPPPLLPPLWNTIDKIFKLDGLVATLWQVMPTHALDVQERMRLPIMSDSQLAAVLAWPDLEDRMLEIDVDSPASCGQDRITAPFSMAMDGLPWLESSGERAPIR